MIMMMVMLMEMMEMKMGIRLSMSVYCGRAVQTPKRLQPTISPSAQHEQESAAKPRGTTFWGQHDLRAIWILCVIVREMRAAFQLFAALMHRTPRCMDL